MYKISLLERLSALEEPLLEDDEELPFLPDLRSLTSAFAAFIHWLMIALESLPP